MPGKDAREDWARAAVERGYRFRGRIGQPSLPGLVFGSGTDIVAEGVVDALQSPTPFLAGSVRGMYQAGSSLPRRVGASFIAIPLPRDVPNLVLFGTGFGFLMTAGFAVGSRHRLSLEGDFDRTFSLYCPTGYERDALYLFAPDLMALLVDATGGCDVELVDRWMFVYARDGRFGDAVALDRVVATVETVGAKLHRQTHRYSDERAARTASPVVTPSDPPPDAPRTVSPEEHAAARSAVAEGGRRVRTRSSLLQRLVTIGGSVLVAGALLWWLVTEVLPRA